MTFSIRPAKIKDVPSIVALYFEATKLMHQISPDGFGKSMESSLNLEEENKSFTKALDDKDTVILVAEQDRKVAGFIMGVIEYHPDDLLNAPYLTVQYLCVDKKFRRTGIGKSLMKSIENWGNDKGISTLELIVWNNNEPAKALFRSLGYLPLEVRMAKKIGNKVKRQTPRRSR